MKNYSDFTVERFVMDESFQEHVRNPTAESAMFWERWADSYPHKAEEIRQARLIILAMDFEKTAENAIPTQSMLRRIQHSMRQTTEQNTYTSHTRNFYYRIAAVFLGLLVSTASLYFLMHESFESHATTYGEIRNLTLPDGSNIVLNANSLVRFRENWDDNETREVWVKGEAFFNVVHKTNHQKFVVHTDQLDVEVLGTAFNVNNRRNTTKVVLESGKVKLNAAGLKDEILYMKPGELAEVSNERRGVSVKPVNPEEYASWKNKQLVFRATVLSEVAQTLEDNYGLKFSFEDEAIKSYQFTGTVSTESVEQIDLLLFTISEAFNIELLKEGKNITLKNK